MFLMVQDSTLRVTSKKKIVGILCDSFSELKGGVENHARILGEYLKNNNYEVIFFNYHTVKYNDLKLVDIVIVEGIYRPDLVRLFLYRKNQKMILFTHGSLYYLFNLTVRKNKGFRRFRSIFWTIFDHTILKYILGRFDRIITLSQRETQDLTMFFKFPKHKLIDLPVLSDEFMDLSNDVERSSFDSYAPYLCYVGRIERRKNLIELLKASEILNMNVLIAGQDQGALDSLKTYASTNMKGHFYYLGTISNIEKEELIRGAVCFVIPSLFEGMPLSAIESLKIGRHVVMTRNSYMFDSPCVHYCEPNASSLVEAISNIATFEMCNQSPPSNSTVIDRFLRILTEL